MSSGWQSRLVRVRFNATRNEAPFRVERQSLFTTRWIIESDFRTLILALQSFPTAEVLPLAQKQQEFIENTPHVFDSRFRRIDECWQCSRPGAWPAHQAAAAARGGA